MKWEEESGKLMGVGGLVVCLGLSSSSSSSSDLANRRLISSVWNVVVSCQTFGREILATLLSSEVNSLPPSIAI